jgi:hypothetical protein
MRGYFALAAGLVLAVTAPEAHAQRFFYRNTYVAPAMLPGNYSYSTFYNGPNGYQTAVTSGVYPTPFGGYNTFYSQTTSIRPIYSSPYLSVIWDPTTMTYRTATGYANTPNYSYFVPNFYFP